MKTLATDNCTFISILYIYIFILFKTEAPLMIQPFLKDMTNSELHAVMTGGFATIAGSVLGAYINFGVYGH